MRAADFWATIFNGAWNRETSDWGWRTYRYMGNLVTDFHLGNDRASGKSNAVYPYATSYVVKIGKDSRSGNYIYLWDGYDFHFYCHMASIVAKVGQVLTKKNLIGMTGNTGHSTAVHLHYGIRKSLTGDWMNPAKWIAEHQPISPRKMYVNSKTGLNVRNKPSILGAKITALPDNREVIVYLKYKGWSYISFKVGDTSKHGWVKSEYLSTTR